MSGHRRRLRAAVAALSFHLPQDSLCAFLDGCRRVLDRSGLVDASVEGGGECSVALVVDEWEGLHDLARVATHVDVLSFSQRRRGFGVARTTALQEGRVSGAPWVVVVDADGQHEPAAIERVLAEAERSDWDAVIPQRTLVDLPLRGGGALDRVLAERFEAWVAARSVGRLDQVRADLQPGLFLLRPVAVERLLAEVHARRYEWDLEAARCLLGSGLQIGFPPVESHSQPTTFFGTADSIDNLRLLRRWVGEDGVRAALTAFRALDWVEAEHDPAALDLLSEHLEEALRA